MALFVARQDERAAEQSAQKTAQLDKGTISTKPNEKHTQDDASNAARYSPGWYGIFRWPNGTTTWAIILTLMVMAEQTKHTKRAVEASRGSIRLQEAALEQWVIPKNWRSSLVEEGDSPCYSDMTQRIQIRIRVDLVNGSDYPLTLSDSSLTLTININGKVLPTRWQAPKNYPLHPDEPLTIDIPMDISPSQLDDFEKLSVLIMVEGAFEHVGVLGKKQTDPLHGMLFCGRRGTRFDREIPSRTQDYRDNGQNPN